MRALVVAALALVGCDEAAKCPAFAVNDAPCATYGLSCAGENGSCTCYGNWSCPGPVVHDLAVPDLSIRDLAPPPGD
jgi:hypothetical protein